MWWTLLLGCPWVGAERYDRVRDIDEDSVLDPRFGGRDCDPGNPNVGDCDADADGFRAPPFGADCDDGDPSVHPDATEVCNGIDDDCDGRIDDPSAIASELLTPYYIDRDDDGTGDEEVRACAVPPGAVTRGGDCDDEDPAVGPDALERCDDVDRNCDGDPHRDAVDATSWFIDADRDGFGAGTPAGSGCIAPEGAGPEGDCDDADPAVHPDAPEICNLIDDDCDGLIDDADGDAVPDRVWALDRDGDGYVGLGTERLQCTDPSDDASTYLLDAPADCDDADPSIQTVRTWYVDADSDGYGAPDHPVVQCLPPPGSVSIGGDCDDQIAAVAPSSPEVCNGIDDNCDGAVDEGTIGLPWREDQDGDGYGDAFAAPVHACIAPSPTSTLLGGDCDDTTPSTNPAGIERCNGIDDDCDGAIDDDDPSVLAHSVFLDLDGDGVGVADVSLLRCEPPLGFADASGDCDDGDPAVYRGTTVFPSSSDGADLQEVVDTTCDGGTVLLEDWEASAPIWLPARGIEVVGAPGGGRIHVPPGSGPLPADVQYGNLFNVPPGGALTLRSVQVDGEPGAELPYGRSMIRVAGDGFLAIEQVAFTDLGAPNNLVHLQSHARATVASSSHTGIDVGNRGLYRMDSRASLEITDSRFASIETTVTQPYELGVLLTSTLPDHLVLSNIEVRNAATVAGAALFKVQLANASSAPARFEDVTVESSGRVLIADGHPVELVRQRWVDAARSDPGPDAAHRYTTADPCRFDASDPLLRPFADRDVLSAHGGASVLVRNSEIIGSGSMCVDGADGTALQVEGSVVADPVRTVARGGSTSTCADGGTTVPILPVQFTDSVWVATEPTADLVLAPLDADANTWRPAALADFEHGVLTSFVEPPLSSDGGTCVTQGEVATVEELGFVSPRTLPTDTPRSSWLLHPWLDACDGSSPLLVEAGVGTMVGEEADVTWLIDGDMDGMPEAWERFWFDSTSTCDDAEAYALGLPPAVDPLPVCDPATAPPVCP